MKRTHSPAPTLPTIVFTHLLDDLSGSPRVLASVIEGLRERGWPVEIWTSQSGGDGFLRALPVQKHLYDYHFFENKWKRLAALIQAQVCIFRGLWQYRHQSVVIYVNTLLPFGAALAGWLMGKKVVYHLHEATVKPAPLRWLLRGVARLTASRAIYVSKYLETEMSLGEGVCPVVVPNGLADDFWKKATRAYASRPMPDEARSRPTNCLMICSLKAYKGVHEFVELARAMPERRFRLILNADLDDIRAFFDWEKLPANLVIFPRQSDVHGFYREADVVLNLSRPDGWVESFGMTLLEAMAYGLPVIGPTVGGQKEFVRSGWNGFLVDSADTPGLIRAVRELTRNIDGWQFYSANARESASRLRAGQMQDAIAQTLEGLTGLRPEVLNHEASFEELVETEYGVF